MALAIVQQPRFMLLPVGQDIICVIEDTTAVATKYKVKYICEIFIHDRRSQVGNNTYKVAKVKTSPNSAGVGMFDLRPIVENYVSADNLGRETGGGSGGSTHKGIAYTDTTSHPIHLIDKYCIATNAVKFLSIEYGVEYADTNTGAVTEYLHQASSPIYAVFNGVLQPDQLLSIRTADGFFGYQLDDNNYIFNDSDAKFLTNAPTTQYARLTDYGTFAFFNRLSTAEYSFETTGTDNKVHHLTYRYYDSTGSQLGGDVEVPATWTNGSVNTYDFSTHLINYAGVFPANLDGYSTNWDTHKANISYYTVHAEDSSDTAISKTYTINIQSEPCKGFETIRLTWLNRMGTWDYYNFNMKSTRQVTTKRTTYEQIGGTWNDRIYKLHGFKGGTKTYNTNSNETLKLNSDFLTEDEAIWLEELFTSPEVYILKGFTSSPRPNINEYVEPVVIKSTKYVKKTKANDKLIQYTIDVDKSKNRVIQKV
jgi:hypothetical protein